MHASLVSFFVVLIIQFHLITQCLVLGRLVSTAKGVVDLSLSSSFRLLKHHLPSSQAGAEVDQAEEEKRGGNNQTGGHGENGSLDDMEEEGEEESNCGDVYSGSVGPYSTPNCELFLSDAVEMTLKFVRPFVEEVDAHYARTHGGSWDWTNRQSHCISMCSVYSFFVWLL